MLASRNGFSEKKVGFIVNPIAGMGGPVGLKGTDGRQIQERAVALGAKATAQIRAESFLSELKPFRRSLHFIVGAGLMGEEEVSNCSFTYKVLGSRKKETTAEDTRNVAREILMLKVDLLIFCGGDGTARDILMAVKTNLPVIGVPTGVKMHSAVFAVDPRAASKIAVKFLWGELPLREVEVMDVDEQAFREGRVSAELYGYLLGPYEPHLVQGIKVATPMRESEIRNQAAIALYIIEKMKTDVVYIIGPGTTTRVIADLLDTEKTLLGVDLFCNKKLIAKDANEKTILKKIEGKHSQIIVTPIGGQGFVFGRGNQQISSKIIRQVGLDKIVVVATKTKMGNLKSLRVDTGEADLDDKLRQHNLKVITDYKTEHVIRVT